MASTELLSSKLMIRTDSSELGDQSSVKSISISDADATADASLYVGIKDAVATVIANPVIDTRRVDTYTVVEDE